MRYSDGYIKSPSNVFIVREGNVREGHTQGDKRGSHGSFLPAFPGFVLQRDVRNEEDGTKL